MAGTFTVTGNVYSNLTKLEQEQLRKADFSSGGKALTVGDGEGTVGVGSINAEPYGTGPSVALDNTYSQTPPGSPGLGLETLTQVGLTSETVRWYGPTRIAAGTTGFGFSANQWRDLSADFGALGVVANDILLVKGETAGADSNEFAAATITVVAGNTLTCSNIYAPDVAVAGQFDTAGDSYSYLIIRPNVVQLFAVPGSGPLGREQSFMMVAPGSTLHVNPAPSLNAINADRIKNIVPPAFNGNIAVDRADSVYGPPNTGGPRLPLDTLGYRVVLYKSNNTGTGPDLNQPIATLSPVIDSTVAAADQRMTFDYRAGIVRFSCAPRSGDAIKPTGGNQGVNPTTGRLQLYAIFWAVDQTATIGASRSVYTVRSTESLAKVPGKVYYNNSAEGWMMGSSVNGGFYVQSYSPAEVPAADPGEKIDFGTYLSAGTDRFRGLRLRASDPRISMIPRQRVNTTTDPLSSTELRVADKTSFTLGGGTAPPQNQGADYFSASTTKGLRQSGLAIRDAVRAAALDGYGTVHLRRGKYVVLNTIVVPPGVIVEGEGQSTQIDSQYTSGVGVWPSVFKFGPNTSWGVYDFDYNELNSTYTPTTEFNYGATTKLEGIDVVWNPTRRVWGMVQADLLTNEIWFNEVLPNGTKVVAGSGFAVKNNANVLFSNASTNSDQHTPSHYPRIAYQQWSDEYSVVWVEEGGGPVGPKTKLQVVQATNTQGVVAFTRKFGPALVPPAGTYQDHPSVAVDNSITDPSVAYRIALSYTEHAAPHNNATLCTALMDSITGASLASSTNAFTSYIVVSSTDVSSDDQGNFLFAFSVRKHKLILGTTGNIVGETLVDAGIPDFTAVGVEIGSRFLYVSGTSVDYGTSGVVAAIAPASTLTIQNDTLAAWTNHTPVTYYLAPTSTIYTVKSTGLSFGTVNVVSGTSPAANFYVFDVREPDYVRLSRGVGSWAVIYQSFDTTTILAASSIKNWDNNLNTGFVDQVWGTCRDLTPRRLHLATCYALVNDFGVDISPRSPLTASSDDFYTRAGADTTTCQRSLGGRVVPLPNHNAILNVNRPGGYWEMEVAARNYSQPWTTTKVPSLIPDVTWTGQDWVVVSPSVNHIESATGTYLQSGPDFYLADPSFIFGSGGSSVDGSYLPATVAVGDWIYFPSVTQYAQIAAISSEHVVKFTGPVAGLVLTTTYSWYLVRPSNLGVSGGIKNPGFRISARGEVTVSTNFFTFADELPDATTHVPTLRHQETIWRPKMWGDYTVNNLFGAGYQAPTSDVSANWNDVWTTSRLELNLFYRGVAVGAPKGCSELITTEFPMVALAWGENFYGFLDRNVSGSTGAPGNFKNQTVFYRQSFGPWEGGLKDLAIQGSKSSTLKLESSHHIFTRHGLLPNSGSPFFATDGYRNCFAHLAPQQLSNSFEPREASTYRSGMQSIYTDVTGRDPVRIREGLYMGLTSAEFDDSTFSPVVGSVVTAKQLNGSSPRVLWDGQNFVAFVGTTVLQAATVLAGVTTVFATSGSNPKLRGLISMFRFTGGDHSNSNPDNILGGGVSEVGASTVRLGSSTAVASTVISTGASADAEVRDALTFDVAFSGKVFCVAWSMGYNASPGDGADVTGGCMVGYSLFENGLNTPANSLGGYGYGVEATPLDVAFVTNSFKEKMTLIHPKVTWDGNQFVICFVHYDDATHRNIKYVTIPEYGVGSNVTFKALGADNVSRGDSGIEMKLGSIASTGNIVMTQNGILYIGMRPQPGDLVCINRSGDIATTIANAVDIAGWYTVVDYDPVSNEINIGRDLTAYAGLNVYGVLMSGGVMGGRNAPLLDNQFTAGVDTATLGRSAYGNYLQKAGDGVLVQEDPRSVLRIWGLEFDPSTNSFFILYEESTNDLWVTSFSLQSGVSIREPVGIASTATTTYAAIGMNGDSLLVVYAKTDIVYYAEVSKGLIATPNASRVNFSYTDVLGNTAGKMPGPTYGTGAYGAVRGIQVNWNTALGRWQVAVSFGTTASTIRHPNYNDYTPFDSLKAGTSLTTWVDRTVTYGSAFNPTAGQRLMVIRNLPVTGGPLGVLNFDTPDRFTMQDSGQNFTTAGVVSGDWLSAFWIDITLKTARRPLTSVSHAGNVTRCKYTYPILTNPPSTYLPNYTPTYEIYRSSMYFYWNLKANSAGTTHTIDVDTSETTQEAAFLAAKAQCEIYAMPREDVFLFTLSPGQPTVKIKDADGVTFSNLKLAGSVDISEEYLNLARMVQKSGGIEVGEVTGGVAAALVRRLSRPKMHNQLLTPVNKVSTLVCSNVKSGALAKYTAKGGK